LAAGRLNPGKFEPRVVPQNIQEKIGGAAQAGESGRRFVCVSVR
jgi:hypothetical protein